MSTEMSIDYYQFFSSLYKFLSHSKRERSMEIHGSRRARIRYYDEMLLFLTILSISYRWKTTGILRTSSYVGIAGLISNDNSLMREQDECPARKYNGEWFEKSLTEIALRVAVCKKVRDLLQRYPINPKTVLFQVSLSLSFSLFLWFIGEKPSLRIWRTRVAERLASTKRKR